jgi:hypothetical protein
MQSLVEYLWHKSYEETGVMRNMNIDGIVGGKKIQVQKGSHY